MSINVIKPNMCKTGYMHNHQEEFLLDSERDLALLGNAAIGSTAYTADMSKKYRKGPNGEWMEVKDETASGGGGASNGGGVTLWEYSEETFQPSSSGSSFYYIPADIAPFKWVEVIFRLRANYTRLSTRFVSVRHLVSDLTEKHSNQFQTPHVRLKAVTEAEQNYITMVQTVLQYSADTGSFAFDIDNQFEYKYSIDKGMASVAMDNGSGIGVVPFKIVGYYE